MVFQVAARDGQGNLVSKNISEFGDLCMEITDIPDNSTHPVTRYSVRLNNDYVDANVYESKEEAEERLICLNEAINKWCASDE